MKPKPAKSTPTAKKTRVTKPKPAKSTSTEKKTRVAKPKSKNKKSADANTLTPERFTIDKTRVVLGIDIGEVNSAFCVTAYRDGDNGTRPTILEIGRINWKNRNSLLYDETHGTNTHEGITTTLHSLFHGDNPTLSSSSSAPISVPTVEECMKMKITKLRQFYRKYIVDMGAISEIPNSKNIYSDPERVHNRIDEIFAPIMSRYGVNHVNIEIQRADQQHVNLFLEMALYAYFKYKYPNITRTRDPAENKYKIFEKLESIETMFDVMDVVDPITPSITPSPASTIETLKTIHESIKERRLVQKKNREENKITSKIIYEKFKVNGYMILTDLAAEAFNRFSKVDDMFDAFLISMSGFVKQSSIYC